MTGSTTNTTQLSFWQLIFLQSKVNSAPYHGEELPQNKWNWPQGTYLQEQLRYLRRAQLSLTQEAHISHPALLGRSPQGRFELLYQKLLEQS